ncbi:MAG: hypothetical protein ACO1QS_14175 [Verrucomicrobiota bacterium]
MNPATPYPYRHWTIYLGLSLSAICLFTALRIEWYNANSFIKFPFLGRRIAGETTIRMMNEYSYRRAHNLSQESLLTPQQEAEINVLFAASKRKWDYHSDFYGFISSFGLLQYLLVPSLFLLGIYTGLTASQRNRIAIPFTIIAALCGLLMLYRGYFYALGW